MLVYTNGARRGAPLVYQILMAHLWCAISKKILVAWYQWRTSSALLVGKTGAPLVGLFLVVQQTAKCLYRPFFLKLIQFDRITHLKLISTISFQQHKKHTSFQQHIQHTMITNKKFPTTYPYIHTYPKQVSNNISIYTYISKISFQQVSIKKGSTRRRVHSINASFLM